jgi:hypothetical protein
LPHRGGSVYLWAPLHLGFRERWYTRRGNGKSGPGWPHHRPAWSGVGSRLLWVSPPCGSSRLLLLASWVFWQNIIFWYFLEFSDLPKHGVLTVLFPVESWLWQQILQWSSNM